MAHTTRPAAFRMPNRRSPMRTQPMSDSQLAAYLLTRDTLRRIRALARTDVQNADGPRSNPESLSCNPRQQLKELNMLETMFTRPQSLLDVDFHQELIH